MVLDPPRLSRVPVLATFTIALVASLASGHAVRSHGIELDCSLEDGRLRALAHYEDGTPAGGATVRITTTSGEVLLADGKANAQGVFTTDFSREGESVIEATHAGHLATVTIEVDASGQLVSSSAHDDEHPDHEAAQGGGKGWKLLVGVLVILGLSVLFRLFVARGGVSEDGFNDEDLDRKRQPEE